MNCRPGDLAVIVHGVNMNIGRFVEVLYLAPEDEFVLPNGYSSYAHPSGQPSWVIKSLGSPLNVHIRTRTIYGTLVRAWRRLMFQKSRELCDSTFAVYTDNCLRPIRGISEPEQVETEAMA
jgi:hypothetical protein